MEKMDYSEPFNVRIIRDYRNPRGLYERLDGKYATCLGFYIHPDLTREASPGEKGTLLFEVHDDETGGAFIWDTECRWVSGKEMSFSLEVLQRAVDLQRFGFR